MSAALPYQLLPALSMDAPANDSRGSAQPIPPPSKEDTVQIVLVTPDDVDPRKAAKVQRVLESALRDPQLRMLSEKTAGQVHVVWFRKTADGDRRILDVAGLEPGLEPGDALGGFVLPSAPHAIYLNAQRSEYETTHTLLHELGHASARVHDAYQPKGLTVRGPRPDHETIAEDHTWRLERHLYA